MEQLRNLLVDLFPSDSKRGIIGSLELNIFLAQIMGLPFTGLTDMNISSKNSKIFKAYGVFILSVVTFVYTTFELYHLILNWNNLGELAQNACLSLTHLAGFSKILNTLWRLPDLRKTVMKLKKITQEFIVSEKQEKAFQDGEFENKLLFSIYASMVATTGLLGIVILIFSFENFGGKKFPYCVYLPTWFPPYIRAVYMGVSVLFIALQIVSTDFLNVAMINEIRYQLNILILSFDDFQQLNSKQSIRQRIKSIVRHHRTLIEIRNEIESIYRFPILLQFFTSLIIFAMTGFWATVSSTDDMNGAALIYLYSGCIFCELFFYCWFGNEVYEKSKSLSTSAFVSTWYNFEQRFKVDFLIFITNASGPFLFTAGGFMDLSLPSFTGILSKSFSYIAILRQVYGD